MMSRVSHLAVALFWLSSSAAASPFAGLHLERADVTGYPLIKLYLSFIDGDGRVVTGKPKEEFRLLFDSGEQGVAANMKSIDLTGEPVFLVLVVQVSGAMADALEEAKRGVRALGQAAASMKGSKVALISYASDTKRLAELGRPEEIEGTAGGLTLDVEGSEVHLLDTLRTAIDLLSVKSVPDGARKLIVVFSDGLDASGGERRSFAEVGKRAHLANVVVDTVGYAPFEPSKLRRLMEMAKYSNGTARECRTAQEVSAQFANVADELRKQQVVLFQSAASGDGREHTIQVLHESGGRPLYSNNIAKVCENHSVFAAIEGGWWRRWWGWGAGGGALLLVLLALAVHRWILGAPQSSTWPPQCTVALDTGQDKRKRRGPAVGWIVPLSGKRFYQTFRLGPVRTLIGTGEGTDIRMDDTCMSSHHCEVRFDGSTYKIVDLGSTNGVLLNNRVVHESELVDGDLIKLGGTDFKFKSIC